MARGYIYEISSSPNLYPIRYMDANELIQYHGHEFSCIENITYDKNPNAYEQSEIIETLKKYGFDIKETINPKDADDVCLCFTATEQAICNYFQPRFNALKQEITALTCEEFITSANNLQQLIDNQYTDAVYLDTAFYTFDEFMRNITPNTTYYIGNICRMD